MIAKKGKLLTLILSTIVFSIAFYFYQNPSSQISIKMEMEHEEDEKSMQIDRAKAEFEMLKDPKTNKIPRKAAAIAYKAAEKELEDLLKSNATLPNVGIEVRGPNNYGGRCRSLDFDVRNPLIGVAGGVSGGIFRTTNGANSWTSVTPAGQIHNLTTIAQDKSTGNENTWYAGSGEQLGNSASGDGGATYHGNGVWQSTDNGVSWSLLGSTAGTLEVFDTDWDFVHRILVDPTNRNVYAGNAGGVYRSTNQGTSWENVLPAPAPDSQTITEIIRTPNGTFYAAISGVGVYKSTTGNLNSWTQIGNTASLGNSLGRIVLNYAPSNPNIVYALYMGANITCGSAMSDVYLRRWDNSMNTWTGNYDNVISNCVNTDLTLDTQGGYNLCVAVRPNNPNEIFIGGERLYRFTVTGASSGTYVFAGGDQGNPTATNLHVDQHLALFTDNNTLWVTNDGGMRSADVSAAPDATNGFNWNSKTTGLITYQFYRGDISPTVGSNLVGGGAQDNANNLIPTGTTNGTELGGGDGIQFALISGTSLTDYDAILSVQGGSTERKTPTTNYDITPNEEELQGFNTFFVLDADNTGHLYYPASSEFTGTNKAELYRTRTSTTVETTVTGNAATGWQKMTLGNIGFNEDISAMGLSRNVGHSNAAYSASNANRKLYIGTNLGKVYRVADPAFAASYSLTDIMLPSVTDAYVSDIAVNPLNDKEIMVTLSNYNVSSIYHTMDATAATVVWTAIEGASTAAVAKSSVRSAMITSAGGTTLYMVGTSTGLYGTTTLAGASTVWERIGATEIAYAVCVDMRLRTADNKICLATHGNGLFILTPSNTTTNCSITAIVAGTQSACAAATNTYTQAVTVTYTDAPTTGMLSVNGQNFALGTSPQTVTLTGLTADGQAVNATASFTADAGCTFTQNAAFTAPASCGAAPTCTSYPSSGTVTIPESGTVTSTINVPAALTITDLNVKNLQGTHGYLSDLTITLTSPQNTVVTLFAEICDDNGDGFNISLDDQAASAITCPINDNQTEQPSGSLAMFNNQDAMGNWVLTITDAETPDGGQLTSWTLEICGASTSTNCNNPPPIAGNIPATTYQLNGVMTSGGTVASPNTVLFKASTCISLTSNFEVQAGATFEATIETCTPFVGTEGSAVQALNADATPNPNDLLYVQNNAASKQTNIVLNIKNAANTELHIYDIDGKEVAQLVSYSNLEADKYVFDLDTKDFVNGIYTVLLKTGNQTVSKRLILMQ